MTPNNEVQAGAGEAMDPLCQNPSCGHPKSLHDAPEGECGCPSDTVEHVHREGISRALAHIESLRAQLAAKDAEMLSVRTAAIWRTQELEAQLATAKLEGASEGIRKAAKMCARRSVLIARENVHGDRAQVQSETWADAYTAILELLPNPSAEAGQ